MLPYSTDCLKRNSKMKNKEQHTFPFIERLLDGVEVEWRVIGEVAEIYGGLTGKTKSDFEDGNALFVSYKNIYDNYEVKEEELDKVKVSEGEKQNKVEYGDILFTGSSETAEEVAFSSAVTTHFQEAVYLNSFSFGVRCHKDTVLIPQCSKHLFRGVSMRKQLVRTASGVTRFNVSKVRFKKLLIPIPPIHIQQRIVDILDKFTTLEAELEAELEGRKRQYEYYRNQLLSFDILNKEEQLVKNVSLIPLGSIGDICMCKRILKHQTSDKGDIPFYKIGTFGKVPNSFISKELFYKYKEKYNYPLMGDVLISASGTIGRAVIFDGKDAYFQDSNIVWIKNDESKVLNKYLYYYYQIAKWNVAEGGTIQRLYNDNLRKTLIPIPYSDDKQKSLSEQQRIVSILDKFDMLTTSISEGLPKEIELRRKQYEYYRDRLLSFKH